MRYEVAVAKRRKLSRDVRMERRRTGRRPTRSESLPRREENRNYITENEATRIPKAVGQAWKVWA
jgi:hypothetical protein